MREDTVVSFRQPGSFSDDPLTDILRSGAHPFHLVDPAALSSPRQVGGGIAAMALLEGISTGDFGEALAALLGPDAPGLAASTIGRLKAVWWDEYEVWRRRDLSARRYVYFWADGVYFSPRMDRDKQCVLVIVGADAQGNKDIVAIVDGYRESAQSWKELLLDLKRRGLGGWPRAGHRRRRARVLEGAARGLWGDPRAALLGA